jgi:hypothetical protein
MTPVLNTRVCNQEVSMAIVVFLAGGFIGMITAVASMLVFGLGLGSAFALYMTIGVVFPFIALVQLQSERRKKILLARAEV